MEVESLRSKARVVVRFGVGTNSSRGTHNHLLFLYVRGLVFNLPSRRWLRGDYRLASTAIYHLLAGCCSSGRLPPEI